MAFAIHARVENDRYPDWGRWLPLCGRADFEPDELVEDPDDSDCWECRSIAGLEPPEEVRYGPFGRGAST